MSNGNGNLKVAAVVAVLGILVALTIIFTPIIRDKVDVATQAKANQIDIEVLKQAVVQLKADHQRFILRSEYEQGQSEVLRRLARIEDKLDSISKR